LEPFDQPKVGTVKRKKVERNWGGDRYSEEKGRGKLLRREIGYWHI